MNVIDLKDIARVYGFGDAATLALDEINLSIDKGEFVAIMGPSGSGKSTLMNVIGLLDTPSHGEYKLDGNDVSKLSQKKRAKTRREKIGFIFQSFNLLPRLNALDNVSLPLTYKGVPIVKRHKRAEQILENVGLHERQYYMPNQLSGGQVQRVAVARALVNKPAMVLADEPTGNLDSASSVKIMELLKDINDAGNTIVMVTHNPELAEYADRYILLRDGKIEADTKDFNKAVELVMHTKKQAKQAAKEERDNQKLNVHEEATSDAAAKPKKKAKKKKRKAS